MSSVPAETVGEVATDGRTPIKIRRLSAEAAAARTRQRYRAESRFKYIGLGAILIAFTLLVILLGSIIQDGYTAFVQNKINLDIAFDAEAIGVEPGADADALRSGNYTAIARNALYDIFPEVTERGERRQLYGILSDAVGQELRDYAMAEPSVIGTTETMWLPIASDVDQLLKGYIDRDAAAGVRAGGISDQQITYIETLEQQERFETQFNTAIFTNSNSRTAPETAGIWGAMVGSFYMMIVVLGLSAPIGIAAATYLEEFAGKNSLTNIIEVNINNLAAVPSIVFGLLGLAVFLNVMHLPRSAPLVGGLTLTLMTLPTIVVATRAALRSVPPSIRQGALGVGASKVQTITHHVLPLALPGIMTGTIIGMAQALGETAPLLMIGMQAYVVDVPGGFLDPAVALPVQIYQWAEFPERAFVERSAAAIIILLGFLIVMNALAVFLRKKFERKW